MSSNLANGACVSFFSPFLLFNTLESFFFFLPSLCREDNGQVYHWGWTVWDIRLVSSWEWQAGNVGRTHTYAHRQPHISVLVSLPSTDIISLMLIVSMLHLNLPSVNTVKKLLRQFSVNLIHIYMDYMDNLNSVSLLLIILRKPMMEVENFTIFVKNSIRFPLFNVTRWEANTLSLQL